jgi:hypothetical protein
MQQVLEALMSQVQEVLARPVQDVSNATFL